MSALPHIALRHATKRYTTRRGVVTAFDDLDLAAHRGEVVCLLGPSGSGKSTILRVLAGLERLDEGDAVAAGAPIAGPDHHRALVFQDYALFPWLSVAENVAFGPRARGATDGLEGRVADLLALVGLSGTGKARPRELSGGMAQRVALARALANEPDVLLLDEPLGALDARTRLELQDELARILIARGLTAIVVTHDFDEALVLADRVLILSGSPGRVVREIAIDLPRPRDRASDALLRERAALVMAVRSAWAAKAA